MERKKIKLFLSTDKPYIELFREKSHCEVKTNTEKGVK